MKIHAIIPARMASSRFPGKPLIDLLGMPMIEHVWRRSKMCDEIDEVYIATCDEEIRDTAEGFGAQVIMTSAQHVMCMDRVVEAAQAVMSDIVVTVQGDEPLIHPEMLSVTIKALRDDPSLSATTLAQKISVPSEIDDPNRVKMIWNKNNDVLYISRESIPSRKKTNSAVTYYKMVCVYTMRYDLLMRYHGLPASKLEEIESIDMLRLVDNGVRLRVDVIDGSVENIDVPKDKKRVIELLKNDKLHLLYRNTVT